MYVRVMAAVIACILLSGEALSAFAITPATENLSWFKKKKKKPEEREEKSKSDYEKLVEGSKTTKGMFAVHQKKNDFYFEIPTALFGRPNIVKSYWECKLDPKRVKKGRKHTVEFTVVDHCGNTSIARESFVW